MIMCVLWQINN